MIGIAVCYDAFDPTTFLSLLIQARTDGSDHVPKILLVPSFNPSRDFVALLRDLSFLARCAVVYVNALHGDAEMFVCGFSITDFANRPSEMIAMVEAEAQDYRKRIDDEQKRYDALVEAKLSHRRNRIEKREVDLW